MEASLTAPAEARSSALTSGPGAADTQRLDALTGLRWYAAMAVFWFHVTMLLPDPRFSSFGVFGSSGVSFFFVLSGFVLAWSARPGLALRVFYWRRFVRIWPMLAVSIALALPVFYDFPGASPSYPYEPKVGWGIAASLAGVQSWFPQLLYIGNPTAWSLSDEAFFYLLFPFIAVVLFRFRARVLVGVAGVLVAVNLALGILMIPEDGVVGRTFWRDMVLSSPAGRLPEFVVGMALAAALRTGWRCPVSRRRAVLLMCLAVLVMRQWLVRPGGTSNYLAPALANEIFTPFFALLIVAVASGELRGERSMLSRRGFVRLGEASYSFYLVHFTVTFAAIRYLGLTSGQPNLPATAAVLVSAVCVAFACHRFVERPAERWLRGKVSTRPRIPSPRHRAGSQT